MKKHVLFFALLLAASVGFSQRGNGHGNGHNGPRGNGNGPGHSNGNHYGQSNNGYGNGQYNSGWGTPAMNAAEFNRALSMVGRQQFEADRLRVAKQVGRQNLMTVHQIKMMIGEFAFENSRLDFAKFAFDRCVDQGNYYLVNDVFKFSSSARDLDRYVASRMPSGNVGATCSTGGNVGVNGYYGPGGGTTTTYSSGGGNGMSYSGGITTSGGFHGGAPAPAPTGTFCGSCNVYHNHAHICDMVLGSIIGQIERQCFDRDKLMIAKQATRDRLLSSEQARRLTELFTFESTKLDFAKYAYHLVIDPHNYYVVNSAFTFSSSVRELDRYIVGCR